MMWRTSLVMLGIAAALPASAQWSTVDEQFYLTAGHNWVFRSRYPDADRLFNAFDYGHAILYEKLWTRREASTAPLERTEYEFITRKLLVNPPNLPLEEAAVAPAYSRLAPEAKVMFEWAHVLHRQLYDVLADDRLNEAQRDAEVQRLLAFYKSRPDIAFSSRPKSMNLMEGQPYSLAFRKQYPKFNGLIWAYHWLQVGLYDALLAGQTPDERSTNIATAVARFRQMLIDPPRSMPYVMPMTAAIAPRFAARYPEAAIIFDNLHSMHDVISDILANDAVPRRQKRAEILAAAARYRDDTTEVTTREDWSGMAVGMGIENQGGPVVGVLAAPASPTVELGATMKPGASAHAGHPMPAARVGDVVDSLAEGIADSTARRVLVDALFRLLEDDEVQRRVAADSGLRKTLLDLLPLIPEEHRDHYRSLIRPSPSTVMPAKAGIQRRYDPQKTLDPRVRGDDDIESGKRRARQAANTTQNISGLFRL